MQFYVYIFFLKKLITIFNIKFGELEGVQLKEKSNKNKTSE